MNHGDYRGETDEKARVHSTDAFCLRLYLHNGEIEMKPAIVAGQIRQLGYSLMN